MEDDRAQRVNDKPNAADFADQRELALVKATQKNRQHNKTFRLSPPVLSARASEIDTTTTSDENPEIEVLPPETKDTPDEDEFDGSVQSDEDEDDDEEESNYLVPITISVLIVAIILAMIFKMKMKQ